MKATVLLVLLLAAPALADELYAPATPIAGDVIAGYHVNRLMILTPHGGASAEVNISVSPVRDDGSCIKEATGGCLQIIRVYQGSEASTLINALNTANLSTTSLRKRVLTKLAADGVIPAGGTISGTPGVPNLPTSTPTSAPTPTRT